nr:MAG TPA: Protein of unknown function (DUF722) [Caudoviricetes sp.]
MDKDILKQYIDACEAVKETEEQIRQLRKNRKTVVVDAVKGSMHDFPFAVKSFKVAGIAHSVLEDPGQLDREELILEERKAAAAQIKSQVEAWLNTIPVRMQRIIRYRDFEELTWRQVAMKMGRRATEESVKKEYQRFFDEK